MVPTPRDLELWPSVGEYLAYDGVLYEVMTSDGVRNDAFRVAIEDAVADRVVVDVGTGADAVLARLSAQAGARRVYAIEILPSAAESAAQEMERLGLSDTVTVIAGDAGAVELPEPADVCVSELIGNIGSAEGAEPILWDVSRRLAAPSAEMIPSRCTTHVAAVELPEGLAEDPHFSPLGAYYAARIFEANGGQQFDLRLSVTGPSPSVIVSSADVIEELEFGRRPTNTRRVARIVTTRDTRCDGVLLWVEVLIGRSEVDVIRDACASWTPAYVPLFDPGLQLPEGTAIDIEMLTDYQARLPDYEFHVWVHAPGIKRSVFTSPRRSRSRGSTQFYRRLLDNLPTSGE